ncbi:hypothetical protein M440DRAFT_1399839 [Trichoderma longibrachiatum ATCC 18648]|uniref:Uncharacterized protein n=1 Tax=Trichoderma longibrachiatum ATCC 18648 TaxID=983965 RepID=A0A2T4CAV2_TRILO|nr:hypothetical protein M440DRAFT_1399839 [Trichoderma longibrachiatum ATCC 18648]
MSTARGTSSALASLIPGQASRISTFSKSYASAPCAFVWLLVGLRGDVTGACNGRHTDQPGGSPGVDDCMEYEHETEPDKAYTSSQNEFQCSEARSASVDMRL